MNREIKFRIWDKDNNKFYSWDEIWYSSLLLRANVVEGIGQETWISFFGFATKNQNMIVQQFTGLKDKNGKEIYEGDIVKITYEENNPYGYSPEEWDKNEYLIIVKYTDYKFNLKEISGDGGQVCIANFEREIIGNIFENPELIRTE